MFNTDIKQAKIMMVSRPVNKGNCEYKEFVLDGLKFIKFRDLWFIKLEEFLSK